MRIANNEASTTLTEIFSVDNHKCVCFFGNILVINHIKYFKNGKTNKTVIILNDTAKIDNHNTLSTHRFIKTQSNRRYVKNQKTVANKFKKKWLYATCFLR